MYVICSKCTPVAKFVGMSYSSALADGNYLTGTINHHGKVILTHKTKPYPYILTDLDQKFPALVSAKTAFEHIKRNTFDVEWLTPS